MLKPHHESPIYIPGPAGQLEALIKPPAQDYSAVRPTFAIVCHPHPLHGGTMQNKVVSTLVNAFHDLGLWTIRFNFRGVGKSEGAYDEGRGETEDLYAIVDWMHQAFPACDLWLSGFSFGAYIALRGATQPKLAHKVKQLVTIAPAVTHFKLPTDTQVNIPWLLIMGEEDEIVATSEVQRWIQDRHFLVNSIYMPQTTHFFHGQLIILKKHIIDRLKMNHG